MKPVQTGCYCRSKKLIAPDLKTVLSISGLTPSEEEQHWMAPYRFIKACSPHLAAALEKRSISMTKIKKSFAVLGQCHELVIVEGAGGILTPLSDKLSMLDIMKVLSLPVIVVARPGLGTLNHTLLTLRELRQANLKIMGVVLNHTSHTPRTYIEKNNRQTIEKMGHVPIIAELPFIRNLCY
jgi:dethiobiotin synthetase